MLSLRRIQALFLLVAVLVVSLGVFVTPASSSDCSFYISWCCSAIATAELMCAWYGSGSWQCKDWQSYAGWVCATAADVCGYPTYHLCSN